MREIFNSWEALNKAAYDESTAWGQRMALGEEILIYEDGSEHLLLSDEPVNDPNWVEVEL